MAEAAARFYSSLLPDRRIERITHAPVDTPYG
jgi:predicted 3-demethylubiquinone-9 3-methyltransferase (glyoxalase superfamily)